jgi:hypothetical protein
MTPPVQPPKTRSSGKGASPPSRQAPTAIPNPGQAAPVVPRWLRGWRGELVLLSLLVLALAIFFTGYWVGMRDDTFHTSWYSPLDGTRAAPLAVGSVQGGRADRSGNTPLLITVRGLKILPSAERYVLYLVRPGRESVRCGQFSVGRGTTQVHLSAAGLPVEPRHWLVARELEDASRIGTVVLRTTGAES